MSDGFRLALLSGCMPMAPGSGSHVPSGFRGHLTAPSAGTTALHP
ncbi:MAG TPA: hypothetical protein VK420_05105 [Longimicrobium sp.]|nr:hypothetical protein [Longimicrobium sp.]